MPKRITPLSDTKVRSAKPQTKEVKLFDGGGLFLLITPTGGKLWRFKYRYAGKEKKLTLGAYPEISLSDARQRREEARRLLANGVDPGETKKAQKAAKISDAENSFEVVAREWHGKFLHTWTEGHAETIMARLEQNVFPWLGGRPTGEVEAPEVLAVLRRVEARGALETAHRIKSVPD